MAEEESTAAQEDDHAEIQVVGEKMKGLKQKLTASASKGKGRAGGTKTEELGPSGQTYTPLEKQVLKLKEENEGVLLIFEVRSLGHDFACCYQGC